MAKRPGPISEALQELFDAERTARRVHDEIVSGGRGAALPALKEAVSAALAEKREDEAALRLTRLAAILGEMSGPEVVDLLVDVLGSTVGEARYAAGEALTELAFD